MNISLIIDKVYKPSLINLKSFELKKKLNPKIWIHNKMNPKVRVLLIKIAKEFIKSTDIKFIPTDIIMVGSLASYNWSKYSDIDLHIYCDFKKINEDTALIKNYFDAKKNEWNNTHGDITIFGYEVELYVQDIDEVNASNGIYSIKNNMWIKYPEHVTVQLKSNDIKRLALDYISKIDYYMHKFDELNDKKQFLLLKEKCDWLYKIIRDGRKNSLNQDGELATGNIVFKVLRRSGHLGLLWDLRNKIFDKLNSLTENNTLSESYFDDIEQDIIPDHNKNIAKSLTNISYKNLIQKLLDKYDISGEVIGKEDNIYMIRCDIDDILRDVLNYGDEQSLTPKVCDLISDINNNRLFNSIDFNIFDRAPFSHYIDGYISTYQNIDESLFDDIERDIDINHTKNISDNLLKLIDDAYLKYILKQYDIHPQILPKKYGNHKIGVILQFTDEEFNVNSTEMDPIDKFILDLSDLIKHDKKLKYSDYDIDNELSQIILYKG